MDSEDPQDIKKKYHTFLKTSFEAICLRIEYAVLTEKNVENDDDLDDAQEFLDKELKNLSKIVKNDSNFDESAKNIVRDLRDLNDDHDFDAFYSKFKQLTKSKKEKPSVYSNAETSEREHVEEKSLLRQKSVCEDVPNLENLQQYINRMPLCSEKIILETIFLLTQSKDGLCLVDLDHKINSLTKRLELEDFLDEKISNLLRELRSYLENQDLSNSLKKLYSILNNIRDFDINELIYLINSNDESLDRIKNRNIYVLFGLTGSGKSTTIHFLSGSKFKEVDGHNLEPKDFKNTDLKKVVVKNSVKSETKSVIPVRINAQLDEDDEDNTEEVIFCDSPGFSDTNGPEIDISNSIAIKKAIESCAGIKPIIVISKLLGDRFESLPKLTHVLFRMFVRPEDLTNYCAYVFTKYLDDKEKNSVRPTLIKIRKEIEENQAGSNAERIDISFKEIVCDIINKTKEKKIFIDPITDKDYNKTLRNICDGKFIKNPSNRFNISFSYDSKEKVAKQISKHFKLIEYALKSNETELAIFKLEEILKLQEIVKQSEIDEKLRDYATKLKKSLDFSYNQRISYLHRKLQRNELLNEDDLVIYLNCLKEAKNSNEIMKKLFGRDYDKAEELKEYILKQTKELLDNFKRKNFETQMESIRLDLDNLKIIADFTKADQFLSEFEEDFQTNLVKRYKTAVEYLKEIIGTHVSSLDELLTSSRFNTIAKMLQVLKKFNLIAEIHLQNLDLATFSSALEKIKNDFEIKSKEPKKVLNKDEKTIHENLDKEIIPALCKINDHFCSALECGAFHEIFQKNQIENFYEKFITEIRNYLVNVQSKLDEELNENDDDYDVELVNIEFEIILKFYNEERFKLPFEPIYIEVWKRVCQKIKSLRDKVENKLDDILKQNRRLKLDLDKLIHSVHLFKKSEWFDRYNRNFCKKMVNLMIQKIADDIERTEEELGTKNYQIKLQNLDSFKEIQEQVKKIVFFESLIGIFPVLKEKIVKRKDWYVSEVRRHLNTINKFFDQYKTENRFELSAIDYKNIQNWLDFILECQNCNLFTQINGECDEAYSNLVTFIQNHLEELVIKMNQVFETIKEKNTLETLSLSIDELIKYLSEVSIVVKEYPQLAGLRIELKDEYSQSIQLIGDMYINLETKINNLSKSNHPKEIEKLIETILKTKALAKLDKYLDPNESFSALYRSNANQESQITRDIFDRIMGYIEGLDFENFNFELIRFKKKELSKMDQYNWGFVEEKLKNKVQNLTSDLLKDAIRLFDNFDEQKVETFAQNLTKFGQAQKIINGHFQFKLDAEKIEKKILELFVKLFHKISKSFKQLNVDEINKNLDKLNKLKHISNLLSENLEVSEIVLKDSDQDSSFGDCSIRDLDDLKEKTSDIQIFVKENLLNSITELSKVEIKDYSYRSPKEVSKKLNDLGASMEIEPETIVEAKQKLEKIVLEKFEEKIKKYDLKVIAEIENYEEDLKSNEKYLDYLSDELKNQIELKFKKFYEECQKILIFNDLELETKNNESIEYQKYFDRYLNFVNADSNSKNAKKIKEHFIFNAKEIYSKFKSVLNEENCSNIWSHVGNLKALAETFNLKEFSIIETTFAKLKADLKEFFNQLFKNFEENILNSFTTTKYTSVKIIERAGEIFENLLIYSKFEKECFIQTNKSFEESLIRFDENFISEVNKFTINFDKTIDSELNELNINQCIDLWEFSIEFMIKLNPFILKNKNLRQVNFDLKSVNSKIESKISSKLEKLEKVEFLIYSKAFTQADYDSFFLNLGNDLEIVKKLSQKFSDKFPSLKDFPVKCESLIEKNINNLYPKTENSLDEYLKSNTTYNEMDFDAFDYGYLNLKAFENNSKKFKFKLTADQFEKKFLKKVTDYIENISNFSNADCDLNKAAETFSRIKFVSVKFYMFKDKLDQILEKKMEEFISKNGGFDTIGKIALILNQEKYGNSILNEHKLFSSYQRSVFNSKTSKRKIEDVLANMEKENKSDIEKGELQKIYKKFEKKFETLVSEYLKPDIQLKKFITNLKYQASNIQIDQRSKKLIWNKNILNELPELIAYVFALWTLLNAEDYFKIGEKQDYLFKPHCAQVLAIFRMLGLGYYKSFVDSKVYSYVEDKLNNCLIQIGTGEGKSVTLAVTSVILALIGFDVYCVCYSNYLSERDYSAFKSLFDKLDLTDKIHYGTFNRICEMVINVNGDLRTITENLILDQNNSTSLNLKKFNMIENQRILLVDEVDVFFSKDFYGSSYNPSATLRDPTITQLIKYMWTNRQDNLTYRGLMKTQEYQNCSKKFDKWNELLNEALKDLITDLKTFNESHDYVVKDDKIGYKEQDEISFEISYGYKTLFSYFYENEKSSISTQALNENIFLKVKLGSFSYAEVPFLFKAILGVTGTLDTLSSTENKIIKENYNINLKTFMPSIYDRKVVSFEKRKDEDLFIEKTKENYYRALKKEIDRRLVGRNKGTQRAVFVFFETKKKLMEFYQSDDFSSFKNSSDLIILTEEANPEEKANRITESTNSGKVTLFTRVFGRGTDFKIYDNILSANGGIHVIQTFLSSDKSEEKQIRGRTGRQDEDGSFSMVLFEADLEKFSINPEDIDKTESNKIYKLLDEKRNDYYEIEYKNTIKYVESLKDKHSKSMKFVDYTFSPESINDNFILIKSYLVEENKGRILFDSNTKTLILIDATGSMSHLLKNLKETLETVFLRAFAVLKTENLNDLTSFQIKIVAYRNYNSPPDLLLQQSTWESKAENLIKFLGSVDPLYGWGNEAIEVALWQANEEADLSQIVLIGDAPPNTKQEVQDKRSSQNWTATKYKNPTYYEDELNKIKNKDISVHCYYLDNSAKQKFNEIATQTGGKCDHLDIFSEKGPEMLINHLTVKVLEKIGGSELVKVYHKKYGS